MNIKIVQVIPGLMMAAILISTNSQPGFASTSVPITASRQATSQPAGPTDPQKMEAFLNNFITAQLKEDHISGAVVSVVKDGELFSPKVMASLT